MPDDDPAASALGGIRERAATLLPMYPDSHYMIDALVQDVPRLLKAVEAALKLHARQDKPVHFWEHVCDAHRDQRGLAVQPPPRDCPDCRFRDVHVCKHCECPHDEWPCPTYRDITAALAGRRLAMATRNDARLWAHLCEEFYAAGATSAEARGRHARRAVALVRRERTATGARTFAPGDDIPYDVTRAYNLDGDIWERQPWPPDSLKDTWKMPGFDPAEHESAAGGCYVTPHLLDEYGPLTEIPARRQRPAEGNDDA